VRGEHLTPVQRGHARPGEIGLGERRAAERRSSALDTASALRRQADAPDVTRAERDRARRALPDAFERRGGRWVVRSSDRLPVVVRAVGPGGDTDVLTRSSRVRKLVRDHRETAIAVLAGLAPEASLQRFRHRRVGRTRDPATGRWTGPPVELEVDVDRLAFLYELRLISGGPYPELPPTGSGL
jgi:hypothetical protein